MSATRLLYQLQEYRILLWKNNEGNLAFSVDKSIGFSQELKEQVKHYKTELLFLLEYNDIHSEEQAKCCSFYKIPEQLNKQVLQTIQKGMYLQTTLDEQKATYTVPLFVFFKNANPDVLKQAIQHLVNRNPILRMRVVDGFGYEILPENSVTIHESSISAPQITLVCEQKGRRAFAVDDEPLIHLELMQISDTQDYLVNLTHHHMLSDAYSADLMINELVDQYQKISKGFVAKHERTFHYFDYTFFQDYSLNTVPYQHAIHRLAQQLDEAEPLNLLARSTALADNRAGFHEFRLEKQTYKQVQQLALEHEISVYSLLLTGLYQVLSTYSGGQTNFPIALTVSNRLPEMNQVIGPFINTLPLVPEYKKEETVLFHAQKIHEAISFLNTHHQINLDVLAQHLKRSHEDLPALLQVLFTFHNFKQVLAPAVAEFAQPILLPDCYEKFGISIIAKECDEGIYFTVTYFANRYESGYITQLFECFTHLLTKYGEGAGLQKISSIHLLDECLENRIVHQLNHTEAYFPQQKTINQLFEEQVARTPENIAVVYEQNHLTYEVLNNRANQLAHFLREHYALKPDTMVCLCLDRSEHMMISILAVLKAGAAYVPIAPDFPQARIEYLIQDTQTPLLLTNQHHQSWLASFLTLPVHAVDETSFVQQLAKQPCDNLAPQHTSDHLAYVIYTSGTTGQPKGVMVEHRGVVNRIHWMNRQYPLSEQDKIIQKTPYVFDVSVWELLWAHWYGACLVFAKPEGHKDADYLYDLMRQEEITRVHFVPSMLNVFMDALDLRQGTIPNLRMIFCSGEALKLTQVKQVHDLLPHTEIHNLYGPTEASIDVLYADCSDKSITEIVIGKPIDNTTAYVLDEYMNPLPFYALGELYIGGVGLARGYLNRVELTKERFVTNPFQSLEQKTKNYNSRLYKTGDIVSLSPDGAIAYHGRNDFQVKIRGHRIELGEIEQALLACPQVKQSLVVVKKQSGQAYLVGYYVSDAEQDEQVMLEQLARRLPEYMVPTRLVHLDSFPLTANGKLDLKNLPEAAQGQRRDYELPSTELEQQLSVIWSEVLGIKAGGLSVHDDFFRLGGDSIISIQLISRIRQRLQLQVSVKDLFSCRTLRRLHEHLVARCEPELGVLASGEQGLLRGSVGLLPIQDWFFAHSFAKGWHWNQSFLIKTPALDVGRLRSCLQQLVAHHDAFRLRFRERDGTIEQYYDAESAFAGLQVLDVSGVDVAALEEQMTLWQSGFNGTTGPLYCVAYLSGYADGSSRIYVAMHHLLVDAVSWRILADDLHHLYEGQSLGAKGSSYRQWVDVLQDYAEYHEDERAYWQEVVADLKEIPALEKQSVLSVAELELGEEFTSFLLREANGAYHTQINDLLLTALAYALNDLSGESVHHVTLEGHGREDIAASIDVTRTVGWFTSLYPVRLALGDDLGHSIKKIKDNIRQIPNKGIGYGALLGYAIAQMPVVSFNYLGQFEQQSEFWHVVDEPSGQAMHSENQDYHLINILGMIVDGRLKLRVDAHLDEQKTQQLLHALHQHLHSILAHCQSRQDKPQYTPGDFKGVLSEADLAALPLLPSAEQYVWFPMTEIQKAYLLGRLGEYEIGNVSNHVYSEYYYPSLDVPKLETIINYLIKEYPVLRTVYSYEQLQQRFLSLDETPYYSIKVNDYRHLTGDEKDLQLIRERLSHQVYDPQAFPLFAFEVTQFRTMWVLHVSSDLILLDVKSRLSFFSAISALYRNPEQQITSPSISFKDYQEYYQLLKHSIWYVRDKEYWEGMLPSMPLRPSFPFKQAPEQIEYPTFSAHTLLVDKEDWTLFKQKASDYQVSYSSVLLSLYGSVLAYFSGHKEFLITLTLFNRYAIHDEANAIWGDFTTTDLFHFKDLGKNWIDTFERTHQRMWDDINHALYTGMEVQRALSKLHGLDATEAASPIVFTGVVGNKSHHFDSETFLQADEFKEKRYWCGQTSQAWIDLQAVETGDCFMSKWLYVDQLFTEDFIATLNQIYCNLIKALAHQDWNHSIDLSHYLPKKHQEIIAAANQYPRAFSEETLVSAYERSLEVAGCSELIAVIDAGKKAEYSHGELWSASEQVVASLLATGSQGRLIAVLSEKGYSQVVATLSIMKAGYAYLPLHVDWPLGRVHEVLKQGGVELVLLSRKMAAHEETYASLVNEYEVLIIEDALEHAVDLGLEKPKVHADDVAYVIFTSGSTGKPKGVTISHRGALNTIEAVNEHFGVSSKDKVLALSELSFDLSVYDIYGLLLAGGCIVFPEQEQTKEPKHWLSLIETHQISLWNTVPQLAGLLVDEAEGPLPSLRTFLLSGDWIPVSLPKKLKASCPEATVMSLGGATEGSIWSIWYPIEEVNPNWSSIPYGVAMPNQHMYVLNQDGAHCPVGVMGEIHIGGMGVALNYWGDEAITQRQFFTHPQLGKVYRTGDLGRWHEDGYMEFCGRNDFQVKIRGHRIELGEIEQALLACPQVKQSLVVVKKQSGQAYLVGYYVSDAEQDEQVMLEQLARRLPEYMVPTRLVHLDSFPLTANGKLDLKNLPEAAQGQRRDYELPSTELEQQLSIIWSEVLGIKAGGLSVHDDFFRLGGDSIISIQLISRIRQRLQLQVSVKDLFSCRTLRRLHEHLVARCEPELGVLASGEQGLLRGSVGLLPIQDWFFAHSFAKSWHWNQSFLIKTPALDVGRLRSCLQQLVAHHDAFRLRFRERDGRIEQYYDTESAFSEVQVLDVSGLDAAALEEQMTLWQSGFNGTTGPLYCFAYLSGYADGSSRIYIAMHHLLVDAVSWRILADDLHHLYEGQSLGAKGSSYRQWVDALQDYAEYHEDERAYWQEVVVDLKEIPALEKQSVLSVAELELGEEFTSFLLREANGAYHTQINDLLLTALAYALNDLSGEAVHHVTLEGHGREDIAASIDVTRTVGWFTSLYPVRLALGDDLGHSIKKIKDNIRQIPNKGIGYGALLGYAIAQMPVVSFNYLGQFEQQSEFWHVVDEPSGQAMHSENQETHCITCFGGIHQGRLRMVFRTQLPQEVTDRLALVYKKQLLMILEHQRSLARSFLTLSDIHHCVSARCLDKLQRDRELDGVYLANSLHQGFMYHFMSQGQKDEAYRMQIVWSYDRELNIDLLQRAWGFGQQRYPSLRLRFLVDEELVQVIDKTGYLHWQFIDLSQDKDNQDLKIQQLIQEDRHKAYDLTQGNLFRIQLIKQEETSYICIFNAHHAIIDGWSGPLLLGFVHEMYMKLFRQERIDFTVDTAYAQSQHFLQVQELENQSFWQQYMGQIEHKADLSNLLQQGKKQLKLSDYKYIIHQSEQTICIAQERFKQIKMMSQEQGLTLNAIILYAWHKVMRIYGNGKQTVVGTIVSGRNIPVDQVEHSVGLYINTLPMIVDHTHHDGLSVLEAIRSVQEISNEINQRSAMSLAKLQRQGERLFDCLFLYGNYPNLAVENPEKQLSFKIQSTFEKRDYPLSLAADEEESQLRIKLTYAGELFDSSLMTQLLATLNYLLDQIARNPLQRVHELNYMESRLPEPSSSPVLSRTFIDYFEEQVSLHPERIALVHEQTQISYAQLNQRANQLAHYIRQQTTLEKDSLIGLCLEKNEYLMIALLAVLKAGSAYLPIDPAMPAQRVQHILEDSQAKLVLTCGAVRHKFPQAVILDDPDAAFAIAQQATSNVHWPLKPDDLAYVLYTSGTTGQPKGVMIEHGAFLQTLVSMQAEYFSEQKPLSTYSMTHFVFDIFGLEYGLPLLTGGKVELGNPLFDVLECGSFDFIQMTPSVCELKLESLQYCESTTFLIGGEALAPELLAKALAKAQRVINVYGPTETTIWSTAKLYSRVTNLHPMSCGQAVRDVGKGEPYSKQNAPIVSIGRPLHHESVYVLDDYLTPMPVGAIGDLYIGGACLARGYLNRPDLTAKQFMTHPLYNRLYKTGDLAKWLPNGELAFIGRNDFQVKIRGHRIELAEIEAVLRMHPQVKQTVVAEFAQNLVAYFTASEWVVEAQLHDFLKEQLPDYMLPQTYMQLEQFPLTVNGKLDRKALPKPNLTKRAHYALPTTEQEKLLASLWEEVLGVSKVGVADNFFDLGGHSISLIKLFSKLPAAIKARITVLDLFKYPSISALLGYLAADKHSEEMGEKRIQLSLKRDDIAIIGMAGRFPGADDLETFWFNLQTGKEGLTYYSREELLEQGLDPSLVDHPNYVKAQCKLSDIKCFDAEFFSYTASEAEIMDPQHRLLMQCAWHALEDANYNPHHYAGDIGLFAGCGQNNYFSDHVLPNQTQDDLSRQFQLMIHQQANFLCTKIAYKLNLTGPAITIQTACSTSLVAVHQACLALNAGDCDIALAGGVSIGQLEKQGYLYQPGLIFSPDAKCRAFDAQAQGTFEGQGVGLVVLKPLSNALADEDFIYAVIKASAINNDGHQKIGFTAPSPQKQAEVITLAQQRAACSPDTISYIEAHGTGTALGDPIEMEGLTQVFKDSGLASGACALGSVKTNIGHLDVAAGIAGLIKTTLCLYHKQLVPTLHYQSANSKINFAASPFYVNTVLKPWTQGNCPRRAGVSSFGIGGTNAHLILEEAPSEAKQERESPVLYPFAKTEYWLPAGKTAAVVKSPNQASRVIVRDREYIISVLRGLWTTLLGIESFKNNEDFFDLGGDSLVAVQLSAQLQRQLGVHLELMSLNRITIDGLLALIEKEQEKTAKARSPVVLIKAGKTHENKIPLVLIHPIGGDVYFYRDLANALPENQAVYALRSPLLDGGTPFASIESMAAAYLHHLQQFGLKPPYILGGSSFGGAVAIEMARQLAQAGQSIPLVALIDTPAYTHLPKLMSQEEILMYLMQHGLGNLQISVAELQAQKTLEQKIEFIANRAKDSELKELLSTEFLPRFLHTWQAHGQLLHQYQPDPYPGRVLFFAHTEVIDDFPAHQEAHWQKLVHGSFKSILVPGTHITMNAAPHVEVIADALVFELKQRYYSLELLVEVEA